MIQPSPPLLVRADTSVGECVRLMRENNSTCVLVIGDDSKSSLIGIFTDRDLIRQIDLIQHGAHWDRPIRTVMSSPVQCLDISAAQTAAKWMVQCNRHHVPLVSLDENGVQTVVGIISMDELFKNFVQNQTTDEVAEADQDPSPTERKKQPNKLKVSLITDDQFFIRVATEVLSVFLSAKVERITLETHPTRRSKFLIFDIDGLDKEIWPVNLQELIKDTNVKLIIIAYSPALHSPELGPKLEKLGKSKNFFILRKPSEIAQLITRIKKPQ